MLVASSIIDGAATRIAHHSCAWCTTRRPTSTIESSSKITPKPALGTQTGRAQTQRSSQHAMARRPRSAAKYPSTRLDCASPKLRRGAHTASAIDRGLTEDGLAASCRQRAAVDHGRKREKHASHPLSQPDLKTNNSTDRFAFPTSADYTPYDVFHLGNSASPSDIKTRYYDLVRVLHPDKRAATYEGAASLTAEIRRQHRREWEVMQQAYELLRHADRRRRYDTSGFGWTVGIGNAERSSAPAWHGAPSARKGWEFRGSGHDGFGWQAFSRAHPRDFYGSNPAPDPKGGPRYMPNTHFFLAVGGLTWSLAAVQYVRLSKQSEEHNVQLEQKSALAARSLEKARELAQSKEGKNRLDVLRRRAREQQLLEVNDGNVCSSESTVGAIPAPS